LEPPHHHHCHHHHHWLARPFLHCPTEVSSATGYEQWDSLRAMGPGSVHKAALRHLNAVRNSYKVDSSVLSRTISPSLLVFMSKVRANSQCIIEKVGGPNRWRPHLKTTKLPSVWRELYKQVWFVMTYKLAFEQWNVHTPHVGGEKLQVCNMPRSTRILRESGCRVEGGLERRRG